MSTFISRFFIRGGHIQICTTIGGAMDSYVLKNQTIKQFQGGGKPGGQMPTRPPERNPAWPVCYTCLYNNYNHVYIVHVLLYAL